MQDFWANATRSATFLLLWSCWSRQVFLRNGESSCDDKTGLCGDWQISGGHAGGAWQFEDWRFVESGVVPVAHGDLWMGVFGGRPLWRLANFGGMPVAHGRSWIGVLWILVSYRWAWRLVDGRFWRIRWRTSGSWRTKDLGRVPGGGPLPTWTASGVEAASGELGFSCLEMRPSRRIFAGGLEAGVRLDQPAFWKLMAGGSRPGV